MSRGDQRAVADVVAPGVLAVVATLDAVGRFSGVEVFSLPTKMIL
jgi:hypothetical protein